MVELRHLRYFLAVAEEKHFGRAADRLQEEVLKLVPNEGKLEARLRGPHITPGYWRDEGATAEVLRDGWFHTGDLGKWTDEGYLVIVGRKKELLALSTGKKIAPAAIEAMLAMFAEAGPSLTDAPPVAVGHRVVQGADRFTTPTLVDDAVVDAIDEMSALAPLHNPPNVTGIRAARTAFPDLPHVAVFDTAFFHDLPVSVRTYAIPAEWTQRYAIRRYGFHGIAHEYLSRQLAAVTRTPDAIERAISLHLGQGCSVTALRQGRPEAVYGPGKTPDQAARIVGELLARSSSAPVVLTRADAAQVTDVLAHGEGAVDPVPVEAVTSAKARPSRLCSRTLPTVVT